MNSWPVMGLPVLRFLILYQLPSTKSRCQRRSVSGWTMTQADSKSSFYECPRMVLQLVHKVVALAKNWVILQ